MDWKAELLKRLDALAAKLGTTAEYLWRVLVKQAIADGVFYCFVTLMLIAVIITGIHYAKRLHVFNDKDDWCHDGATFAEVAIIIFVIGAFFAVFATGYDGFMGLFNPEYQALHNVLETLGH